MEIYVENSSIYAIRSALHAACGNIKTMRISVNYTMMLVGHARFCPRQTPSRENTRETLET